MNTLLLFLLGSLGGLAVVATIRAIANADEGYEDEAGFHFGVPSPARKRAEKKSRRPFDAFCTIANHPLAHACRRPFAPKRPMPPVLHTHAFGGVLTH